MPKNNQRSPAGRRKEEGIPENDDSGIPSFIADRDFFSLRIEWKGWNMRKPYLPASPMNDSAADLFPGIPRRLGVKIVAHAMHNDRSSQNFIHPEPIRCKCQKCVAIGTEKRGHIPCVVWVGAVMRVVMSHCIRKGIIGISRAGGSFMDMKCKDRLVTEGTAGRKSF